MLIFSGVCGSCVVGVCMIYWTRGWLVVFLIHSYLALLVAISLWVKEIYVGFSYHYPVFITVCHLLVTGLVCKAYVSWAGGRRESSGGSEQQQPPSPWTFDRICKIWPIAFAQGLSIVARNTALDHASVSMVEMLSSSTPLVTICISTLMGEKFGGVQWIAVVVVCVGTVGMLHGDKALKADMLGIVLVFVANVTRSTKSVLQNQLLKSQQGPKPGPADLWVEMAPPTVVLLMLISAFYEGLGPYRDFHLLGVIGGLVLCVSCIAAAALNTVGLQIMGHIGATGMHIIGSLKIALTVFASILLFHESVLVLQLVGTLLAMCGAWAFSHKPAAPASKELPAASGSKAPAAPAPSS